MRLNIHINFNFSKYLLKGAIVIMCHYMVVLYMGLVNC
jgi:hypothetical protein